MSVYIESLLVFKSRQLRVSREAQGQGPDLGLMRRAAMLRRRMDHDPFDLARRQLERDEHGRAPRLGTRHHHPQQQRADLHG